MSDSLYKFMLDGNAVVGIYELEHGQLKPKAIKSVESWSYDGTYVTKNEWKHGYLKTTLYTDLDGDGYFSKVGATIHPGAQGLGTNGASVSQYTANIPSGVSAVSTLGQFSGLNVWNSYNSTEAYRFEFDANGLATVVYEVKGGVTRVKQIKPNETWLRRGTDVVEQSAERGHIKTEIYRDPDGDGLYNKVFQIDVANSPYNVRQYAFTLSDGTLAKGGSLSVDDEIQSYSRSRSGKAISTPYSAKNEFAISVVDGDYLIVRAVKNWNGVTSFQIYRDDNNDGNWTEVAKGQTSGLYMTMEGDIDVIGIANAGLLQPADIVIG